MTKPKTKLLTQLNPKQANPLTKSNRTTQSGKLTYQ